MILEPPSPTECHWLQRFAPWVRVAPSRSAGQILQLPCWLRLKRPESRSVFTAEVNRPSTLWAARCACASRICKSLTWKAHPSERFSPKRIRPWWSESPPQVRACSLSVWAAPNRNTGSSITWAGFPWWCLASARPSTLSPVARSAHLDGWAAADSSGPSASRRSPGAWPDDTWSIIRALSISSCASSSPGASEQTWPGLLPPLTRSGAASHGSYLCAYQATVFWMPSSRETLGVNPNARILPVLGQRRGVPPGATGPNWRSISRP